MTNDQLQRSLDERDNHIRQVARTLLARVIDLEDAIIACMDRLETAPNLLDGYENEVEAQEALSYAVADVVVQLSKAVPSAAKLRRLHGWVADARRAAEYTARCARQLANQSGGNHEHDD